MLTPEAAEDPALVDWLEREAAAIADVVHPNVVALLEAGREGARPYLVAEYVEGAALDAVLTDAGALPPELAAYIAAETARGLAAAHDAGVLHRDLKPSNVLLGADGRVKLTDFGLATRLGAAEGDGGEVRGTPGYLAPEVVRGTAPGPTADLFALGALLAETLTGRPAFPVTDAASALDAALHHDPLPPLRADPRLPAALVDVVQRLLAKEPNARYPDAHAAADALAAHQRLGEARGDAGALAAFLADPEAYRAARPAPPTLLTAATQAPPVPAPGLAPDRPAVPLAPPRRRVLWAGITALVLAVSITLALLAVRSGPETAAAPSADARDSLVLTLPTADSLRTEGAAPADPLAAGPPEQDSATPEPAPASTESDLVEALPPEAAEAGFAAPVQPDALPAEARPQEQAAAGTLVVDVQPWAEVFVDGTPRGRTPLAQPLALAAGVHRVVLRNPDFPEVSHTVTVRGGAAERLAVSLWEQVARVTIRVHPYAEVTVGGASHGTIPPERLLVLTPGAHTVSLTHPSLGTWTETVTVRAGEQRTLGYNLVQLLGNSTP